MSGRADEEDRTTPAPHSMLDAPPLALLEQPLEFIAAEHYRHRCICVELRKAADLGHCDCDMARRLIDFLGHDLPLHHDDEEKDFFPMVEQRAHPDDGLATIIAGLREEHRKSGRHAARITELLSQPPHDDRIAIEPRAADLLRTYARHEQRHLAVENGILLVIARRRLKAADLSEISRGMRVRRGLAA